MVLIRLRVTRGDAVIRDLAFKPGLNLLLDKPTAARTESGNSIGKTTVLRLIDFCLGSSGADIWQDPEFKDNINQEVYDFLHGVIPVTVELIVGDAVRGQHVFRRYFTDKKKSSDAYVIDGKSKKSIEEYRAEVRLVLFGVAGKKPTIGQLIPKFVRSSSLLMSKTLRYLGDYASTADYEALHLFLFGFSNLDILEDRPRLTQKLKDQSRDLLALGRVRKEGEIEQLLLHLRREIEGISASPELRGEVPEIANNANVIAQIRASAANAAATVGRFDGEIAAINSAIAQLDDDYSGIDKRAVETIYREAQSYIPKLQHDWVELTEFVQGLRGRKQRFLESQVESLKQQSADAMTRLVSLQEQERSQIAALVNSPDFSRALELRSELQGKLKQLGGLEQSLQDIRDLKEKISITTAAIAETQQKVEEGRALLSERVAIFNKYFSDLSKRLHGEQYLLSFEEDKRGAFVFQLTAVGTNVGSGKKVSQTAAFDLAYIAFLDEARIAYPSFACHDGVESVHGNQLSSLLETANTVPGQLIVATLRDKLPATVTEAFLEANTVLTLAHDDKFFRLP